MNNNTNGNLFDIKNTINGDNVIAFTSSKKMKLNGYLDSAKVFSELMGDDETSHTKHLGMIQLFETTNQIQVPFLKDLFANSQVLTVEEGQTITYDLPVYREDAKCRTAEDTSNLTANPGIDGTFFSIILTDEFAKGDILGYDLQFGDQIMVSEEHEVEPVGENFLHWVTLNTNNKAASFPKSKLKAGIQYYKVGHSTAEFSQTLSKINGTKNPIGTLTNEFILGDPRGVETYMTRKAANMKAPGLNAFSEEMYSSVMSQIQALGGSDMFIVGTKGATGIANGRIGTLLEYFAMMELAQMEANSLMFAKGAIVQTSNGVKRINEGAWHQMRRGKLIKFSRPGGITIDHLHEAASYVFKNTNVPIQNRRIKFKGGYFGYQNVMQILREEAVSQLGSLPAGFLGTDAQIEKIFTGPMDGLKMQYIAITEVPIPGLGFVTVEHDPSLDYQPFSDRQGSGAYGHQMFAHTAHSLVIWDATSTEYANVDTRVKGATAVKGANSRANLYYVKPEGPNVTYGFEQGRMASGDNYTNIQSSMKQMARGFWCYNQSASLLLDTTRYVVIELQRLQ